MCVPGTENVNDVGILHTRVGTMRIQENSSHQLTGSGEGGPESRKSDLESCVDTKATQPDRQ